MVSDVHMPWLGRNLSVFNSTDPSLVGRSGLVVDETKNTISILENQNKVTFAKAAIEFLLDDSNSVINGADYLVRSENRVHRKEA